ncbi:hypothetical protein EIN_291280 [Entamoeba invadens IP1]|uniref:Uncharacterized protein n=1 Tax=Entamoeba invadens IP1 TaxID=370355 RepID=A0A0A1UFY2_ENTIV|nr:hypothetical protein EIN_291280 [Entamoeba invadens IP1]ELP92029.1 hypothetical protein EIN_291280 [Entamoeba invadens IP1]|eukprot:XP_004258800.1 hypothetical protein EIN_291280 [Entamoeba invadens IP1]
MVEKLDAFYIAVVIPYLNSLKTAQRLLYVSRSCKIAILMIRTNPNYRPQLHSSKFHDFITEMDTTFSKVVELERELLLFSGVVTLQADDETLLQRRDIAMKYDYIRLTRHSVESPYLLQQLNDRLCDIKILIKSNITINLSPFKNLRRVTMKSIYRTTQYTEFFKNTQHRYSFVSLSKMCGICDDMITSFDKFNIERLVVSAPTTLITEFFLKCKEKSFVISPRVIFSSDEWCNEDIIVEKASEFTVGPQTVSLDVAMQLYYPTSVTLSAFTTEKHFDISKYTQIVEFSQENNPSVDCILPPSLEVYCGCAMYNTLQHVNVVTLSNCIETFKLPQSVYSASLRSCELWKQEEVCNIVSLVIEKQHKLEEVKTLNFLRVINFVSCEVNIDLSKLNMLVKATFTSCEVSLTDKTMAHVKTLVIQNTQWKSHFVPKTVTALRLISSSFMNRNDDKMPFDIENIQNVEMISTDDVSMLRSLPLCVKYITIKSAPREYVCDLSRFKALEKVGVCNCSNIIISLNKATKTLYAMSSSVTHLINAQLENIYFRSCKEIDFDVLPETVKILEISPPVKTTQKDINRLKAFHLSFVFPKPDDDRRPKRNRSNTPTPAQYPITITHNV